MSGGGYLTNAGVFLIDVLFGLYIFAVMLRFLLQVVRADFYNPLCQAIVTVTNPALRPMRRYIPSIGTTRNITASSAGASSWSSRPDVEQVTGAKLERSPRSPWYTT